MTAANVIQLRQLLAERFPHLRPFSPNAPSPEAVCRCYPTGLPQIDEYLGGGLPKGAVTELLSGNITAGSAWMMTRMLSMARESRHWVALVDGQDCFDPAFLEETVLSHFLWVRCRNAAEALQATDLLLRDGNLSLVLLDLHMNPPTQLRKIPATTWHRFQRLIEETSTALLAITPQPMVSNAEVRLSLLNTFTLEALSLTEGEIAEQFKVRVAQRGALSFEETWEKESIAKTG